MAAGSPKTDLQTLYSDAAAYVAGQRALQEAFGLDLVLATFDYSAIAEAFGGDVAWCADQAPNNETARGLHRCRGARVANARSKAHRPPARHFGGNRATC